MILFKLCEQANVMDTGVCTEQVGEQQKMQYNLDLSPLC